MALAWTAKHSSANGTGAMISETARRVLHRLYLSSDGDEYRARKAQWYAANYGVSLRKLAAIYRYEMSYTPADKLRELNSARPL